MYVINLNNNNLNISDEGAM